MSVALPDQKCPAASSENEKEQEDEHTASSYNVFSQ